MNGSIEYEFSTYIDRPSVPEEPGRQGRAALAGTAKTFALLDTYAKNRRIITVSGSSGSGKCRLLDEWVRGRSKAFKPEQMVMVRLSTPVKGQPMACVVLPRIWDEVQQIGLPAYHSRDDADDAISLYNARGLENLRQRIIKESEDRDVRVIVVARAGLDDAASLELLLDIQRYRSRDAGFKPRFALIMACTAQADGSSPKLIRDLRKMDEIKAEWRQIKLGLIDEREAAKIFIPMAYQNLYATFHTSLDVGAVGAEWLDMSGGSWWLLRELASYIDDELGPVQGKARRMITREVLDQAYQRFRDERQ